MLASEVWRGAIGSRYCDQRPLMDSTQTRRYQKHNTCTTYVTSLHTTVWQYCFPLPTSWTSCQSISWTHFETDSHCIIQDQCTNIQCTSITMLVMNLTDNFHGMVQMCVVQQTINSTFLNSVKPVSLTPNTSLSFLNFSPNCSFFFIEHSNTNMSQ